MKFYISSYKYGREEYQIVLKEWIEKYGNKLIYISNSRDAIENSNEKIEKLEKDKMLLKDIGFEIIDISLKNYFGKKEMLKKDLSKYNTFCLIGGNVFVLRKAMELSGFDEFIKENLQNKDMLYMGYSAGICLLGKTLEGLDIVDKPVNIYNDDTVLYEGLGIIEETIVPHYKSNHPESEAVDKVLEYMKLNNINFITLSDGDVIVKEI